MRCVHLPLPLMVLALIACGEDGAEDASSAASPDRVSGIVSVNGADLRWVREGEGPPLFVLGSSIYYPKAYSRELRDHFEMVFIDGRHFVPSYAPDPEALAEVDLATFADDVEAVREVLGYDAVTVVGHSVHGQIAMEYADRYPDRTERLVLIGPVPYRPSEFSQKAGQLWEEAASDERKALLEERNATLEAVLSDVPEERSFATRYIHMSPLYWADPGYDATEVFEGLQSGPAFDRLFASLPGKEAARERLSRLKMPILLVQGRLDFAIPHTAWEEILDGTPGITYVLLNQDSHNPQTESPQTFDPILVDWMARR